MLNHRSKRERREKIQRANQQHRAEQKNEERAAGNWERACARRRNLLLHQRTRQGHDRHDHQEAAEQHVETEGGVVPRRVARQSREGAAIVSRA